MTIKLTKKQLAVLEFLEEFTEAKGYSPSYREIMAAGGGAVVGNLGLQARGDGGAVSGADGGLRRRTEKDFDRRGGDIGVGFGVKTRRAVFWMFF